MPKKLPIWDERMIMIMDHCIESGLEKTQGSFLKGIGLRDQALKQIISGASSFRLKHIMAAAKKYNVDYNWIFGATSTMKRLPGKNALQNLKDAVKAVEAEMSRKK